MRTNPGFCVGRPGTSIAAAVGGVVLFFILLALLVLYLRRQKKMQRKETMRRILQENEVSTGHGGKCSGDIYQRLVSYLNTKCYLRGKALTKIGPWESKPCPHRHLLPLH